MIYSCVDNKIYPFNPEITEICFALLFIFSKKYCYASASKFLLRQVNMQSEILLNIDYASLTLSIGGRVP